MINIEQLDFSYKKKHTLFKQLNLQVNKGGIYGLLGKNGAGKTTLLKIITGMLYPKGGKCVISDTDSRRRAYNYLVNYYFVPEEFDLPDMSIEQYFKIYSSFYPNFDENQFHNYVNEFKLPLTTKLNKMSYGQKKKFLISFGIAANTSILIFDEPTNGLDIPSKSVFRKIVASALSDDRVFIISTHQVRDIEGLIDSIIVLDNGKITFNKNMNVVSEKLIFKNIAEKDKNEDVLYTEEIFGGYKAVLKNKNPENYSNPDIELLFNAISAENSNVTKYLN